ncbi:MULTISPECIES: hypothetical protein [Spirulina sp. CCY15215]|uniref:hypothetical protein n=1 Tax=Spirulina sp. CCY15215 TaxID=2767591 RepID=UPI0019507193|nr:hypothetical protein [Spirulina major]
MLAFIRDRAWHHCTLRYSIPMMTNFSGKARSHSFRNQKSDSRSETLRERIFGSKKRDRSGWGGAIAFE